MSEAELRRAKRRRAVEKARANATQARAKLVAQHRKLAAIRDRNRERSGETSFDAGTDGTRHSTMPSGDTTPESLAGRSSTVPETVARTDEPPLERLYGLRLHSRAVGVGRSAEARGPRADE